MTDGVLRWSAQNDCQQQSKKTPDPPGQEAHVVTGGGEDGVDRIAFGSGEVVSFQMASGASQSRTLLGTILSGPRPGRDGNPLRAGA